MYFQKVILDVAITRTQDDVKAIETIHDPTSKDLDILCKAHEREHGGRSLKILKRKLTTGEVEVWKSSVLTIPKAVEWLKNEKMNEWFLQQKCYY